MSQSVDLVGHRQDLLSATCRGVQASAHFGEGAEQAPRFGSRGIATPPACDELGDTHVDVKTDLVVHLRRGAFGATDGESEQATNARTEHQRMRVRQNVGTSGCR